MGQFSFISQAGNLMNQLKGGGVSLHTVYTVPAPSTPAGQRLAIMYQVKEGTGELEVKGLL